MLFLWAKLGISITLITKFTSPYTCTLMPVFVLIYSIFYLLLCFSKFRFRCFPFLNVGIIKWYHSACYWLQKNQKPTVLKQKPYLLWFDKHGRGRAVMYYILTKPSVKLKKCLKCLCVFRSFCIKWSFFFYCRDIFTFDVLMFITFVDHHGSLIILFIIF